MSGDTKVYTELVIEEIVFCFVEDNWKLCLTGYGGNKEDNYFFRVLNRNVFIIWTFPAGYTTWNRLPVTTYHLLFIF